jgi:ABC-type multidrug transport system ATPase subunit
VSDPVPEPADAPALRAEGLSHAYGERWVLRELNLELAPGRTLAVLGPNGAG